MKAVDILSAVFGVVNIIQFGIAISTNGTLREKSQTDYFDWHKIGKLAGQLKQDPQSAATVAEALITMSHSHQSQIVAFAQAKLGYTPYLETPWEPKAQPEGPSVWGKIKAAFQPK